MIQGPLLFIFKNIKTANPRILKRSSLILGSCELLSEWLGGNFYSTREICDFYLVHSCTFKNDISLGDNHIPCAPSMDYSTKGVQV